MKLKDNEVQAFLKKMKIFGQNELIKKLKELFPYQYQNAFNLINNNN